MRRNLAGLPSEQKITRVGQLTQLVAKQKAQRAADRREDAADVAWLKKARKKPLHYRPLSDVLADLKQ